MPSNSRRPTKQEIFSWVNAVGGSVSLVPYVLPVQGTSGEGETPYPISVVQYAGIWGQFWHQVAADMKYSLLQFHDDVRGTNNIRALPSNWDIRIPSTGPSASRRYRDQIFTGDPQFTLRFPGIRNANRRAQMEKAWQSYLQDELQREEQTSDQSPLDTQKQHVTDYGCGSRYDVLDLSRWPERPKRKKGESKEHFDERFASWEAERRSISPFVVRTVHPLNFAYDLSTTPPQWAMIREAVFPWEAQARYPHWHGGETFTPAPGNAWAVRTEWWTPHYHAVYINGEPALGPEDGADGDGVAPNLYGHIPIVFAAGGFGEADVVNRPEVLLQGLYRKIRHLLLEDALLFNLVGVYERAVSFGPKKALFGPDTEIDTARADEIESQLAAGPQTVARIPTGWRLDQLTPPPMPEVLVRRVAEIRLMIEEATAYQVASGAPQGGPAMKMQLQLGQVMRRVGTDVVHMEQAMEQWAVNRLRALKHMVGPLKEKVGASMFDSKSGVYNWIDLDPSEIPDHIQVKCNLTSDGETEKARKAQLGLSYWNDKLIGDKDLWEMLQVDDPEGMIARRRAYEIDLAVTLPAQIEVARQGLVSAMFAQAVQSGLAYQILEQSEQLRMQMEQEMQEQGEEGMQGMGTGAGGSVSVSGSGGAVEPPGPPQQEPPGPPGAPPRNQSPLLQIGPSGPLLEGEPNNQTIRNEYNRRPLQPGISFPRIG